jgi:hypothetical protein
MTIEERVRRMLAEAVAAEPAPSGAPFERALRRRRWRPVRAVAVAAALLVVVVVVSGVRFLGTRPGPVPAGPVTPPGWKTFQSDGYNLQFRYPPDWVVQGRGGFTIVPREFADRGSAGPVLIGASLSDYYLFVVQNGTRVTRGSLPDGRAFIRFTQTLGPARVIDYQIDWGQFCLSRDECGAKSIVASVRADSQALLDRYGQVADQIVRTFRHARPTAASNGERRRPACRPDQWRPVFSSKNAVTLDGPGGWVMSGDIRFLGGSACHLRTTLRLTVERPDRTPVPVPGTPSPFTVEADLPENGGVAGDATRGATMWFWEWDNWCKPAQDIGRVRVTADSGTSTTRSLPPRAIQDPRFPCQPNAPWKVVPLP